MEDDNNHSPWFIWLLIGLLVWAVFFRNPTYEGKTAEEWYNEYNQSEDDVVTYKTAFEEANTKIEETNSNIEEAKMYEGASYEDMENALNSLDTVDTVDEP